MKTFTIIVNAEKKPWSEHEITYEQVGKLAFPNPPPGIVIMYTVEYERAASQKHEGSLVKGQSVHVSEGMIFSVTETGRS
jgi:hypothetical protein